MPLRQSFQSLFHRDRRPGDLVFAIVFLVLSAVLLSQLGEQTVWKSRTQLFSQPAFWPAVALMGMTFFAALHCLSSVCSSRVPGRWTELWFWARSIEYALWFMLYVYIVPLVGYLPTTIVFAVLLAWRSGYRSKTMLSGAAFAGIATVLLFKSFLQVKIPGGELYEYLPGALRSFMLTYL